MSNYSEVSILITESIKSDRMGTKLFLRIPDISVVGFQNSRRTTCQFELCSDNSEDIPLRRNSNPIVYSAWETR